MIDANLHGLPLSSPVARVTSYAMVVAVPPLLFVYAQRDVPETHSQKEIAACWLSFIMSGPAA